MKTGSYFSRLVGGAPAGHAVLRAPRSALGSPATAAPAVGAAVPARRPAPRPEDPAARSAKREPEEGPRRAMPGRIEQPEIVDRIAPKVAQGEEPREEREAAPAREVEIERLVEREREMAKEQAWAPREEAPEPGEAMQTARAPERETRERTVEAEREPGVEREGARSEARQRTERVVERWLFGEREGEREERTEPAALFRKPPAPKAEPEATREREETRVEIGRVEVRMSAPEKKRGPAAPKPAAGTLSRGTTLHHGLRQS